MTRQTEPPILAMRLRRFLRGLALGLAILVLLIEDAAWGIFGPLARQLARWRLIAAAEVWIQRQTPAMIAVLFLVPTGLVWPLKLWGLALMALGHPRLGLFL